MDKKSISFLSLGLLCGLFVASVLFSFLSRDNTVDGAASKRVFKLAHGLDPSHPVHLAMVRFAERADELSGRSVEVQIFASGQLGSETECIEQVQTGALAMVKASAAALEGFVPEMAVFGLPYLFRDNDHYWKALNSDVGKALLDGGLDIGLKGICFYDSGSRSFYTVDKPILTPDDLAGAKIRVMRSNTSMKMISQMGGSPTPISFGELYAALQQSMVDGAENNEPSYLSSRHFEVAKHYSLDEHTMIPDIVLFSSKIWQGLSPQIKGWLEEAAADSVVYQRELWKEKSQEALEKLKAEGVKVYYPDKKPFAEKVAPMYDELGDSIVGVYARRIQEM